MPFVSCEGPRGVTFGPWALYYHLMDIIEAWGS